MIDPDVGDETGDNAMLRPGQRGRAARGFGGGGLAAGGAGARRGAGFTEPGEGGWLFGSLQTSLDSYDKCSFFLYFTAAFQRTPTTLGSDDLTSQRRFTGMH